MSDNMTDTERTTSPIVKVEWNGNAQAYPTSDGQRRIGYGLRVRASSLTVTRADGSSRTLTPEPGHSYVEQMLRVKQAEALLARILTEAEAKAEAEGMTEAEAAASIEADIWSGGSLTFEATGRAERLKPVSLAALALARKPKPEAKPEPKPEAKPKREPKPKPEA